MTIDWTRIAVQLGNEGRRCLDEGRPAEALARYREALEALPKGRPSLDALFHYGLAEAQLLSRDLAGAERSLGRSLRINAHMANHEGLDAGRRLRALARVLKASGPMSASELETLELVLELAVRPLQYRLRAAGRAPRLAIHLWDALPPRSARAAPRRSYVFATDRLRAVDGARLRREGLPSVALALRPSGRRVRATIVEDLGGKDTIGRTLWLERQGRSWSIRREELIPT